MTENKAKKDFLQSEEWRKFQAATGLKTFKIEADGFWASIIEHRLPLVGKYFYIPRGPVVEHGTWNMEQKNNFLKLFDLAKNNKARWIRIEPENQETLENIKKNVAYKITKAPHDVQPKEIFVMDITKSEDELLSEMKGKTRYNIKLATHNAQLTIRSTRQEKDTVEFVRLVNATAKRKGITFHAENYYRKMIETIPESMLKLYVAEYNNKVIAANLMVFYGRTATYLHGATDDEYRNVMAPHLLQWQAILDAKRSGYVEYDFGGVKTYNSQLTTRNLQPEPNKKVSSFKFQVLRKSWQGITKFKLGFSPTTRPVEFPGSYDIVLNSRAYLFYKCLQKIKSFMK
jgi:lipid II:glycine glycyltransferase (peptidoglycan interpeptide bridge formation enzyme)